MRKMFLQISVLGVIYVGNHFGKIILFGKKNSDDSEKNVVSLCMAKRHQFLVCYYCKDVDLLLII